MIRKTVIKNTTVFDGISASLLRNVDILLKGSRIQNITSNLAVDMYTQVIDGSKFTVIPGLIDCHIHFRPWMPPLFFQFGVTTVRDVASDPDWIISFREKERNGDNSLPRIVCYGPLLDGVPAFWGTAWKGSVEIDSLETARKVTDYLIEKGIDGFKLYYGLPKKLMIEIVNIAQKANLPVAAHLGKVSAWDAAIMGITSIEHGSGIIFPIPQNKESSYIKLLLRNDVYIDPTFTVNDIAIHIEAVGNKEYPNLALIPKKYREQWLNWRTESWLKDKNESDLNRMQEVEIEKAKFVLAYHKVGGKIVAGSDTPNPFVVPGISLHQEIQKIVEMGLTPLNAIKAATSVAASLLGRKDIGVIKIGNLADLILIEGDPTVNIAQLSNIRVVIKNGEVVYKKNQVLFK
jgi:hypothetical protein